MTVLITTPSFGKQSRAPWDALGEEGLAFRADTDAHPLDAASLAARAAGARALVVGLDRVDAQVLATPGLRVVAKHGVGVDNIDLAAAAAAGVQVVNAPGSNTIAVAELTLGAILAVARRIVAAHESLASGAWERFPGLELSGRTLGVLGFGRIGQAVAARAQAFGMHVVAFDPFLPDAAFEAARAERAEAAEVVARADVLTLHVPGGDGPPLLDAAAIASMRPGSLLVNAARGGLVDEAAAADALRSGHLAGAAFDAFAIEPLEAASPLRDAPNVLLTPHIGAHADGANAAMGVTVVRDIARILRGDAPLHGVRA